MTAGPGGRVAALLGLLREVADEIFVALDDRAAPEVLAALEPVADRIVLYPYAEPVDRPLAWHAAESRGEWVLFVDDDEIPSRRLVAELPRLVADEVITHCSFPRRWVYPDPSRYLDDWPWRPDYALRLVRNDPRFLRFSDEFHRPIVALGPGRFSDAPLWHVDALLRSREARLEKARRYERERPGMRIAGRALNHAFYVPELRPDVATALVPETDRAAIEAVLASEDPPPGTRTATQPTRATREEIDRLWPGKSLTGGDYSARLELLEEPRPMTVGEQRTLDVRVHNLGDVLWDWGREGEPVVRLAARWIGADAPALRTHFPAPLRPGESDLVPVHVLAPRQPGRYGVEIDLVHEHVRWFGCAIACEIEVLPRRRIAVLGDVEGTAEVLSVAPEVELVELVAGDELPSRAHGYPAVPGLRSYLAETPFLRVPRLLARAWSMRAGRFARPLPRGAQAFLEEVAGCDLLAIARRDPDAPPTRQLLRLLATALAARALGVPVAVQEDVVAGTAGPLNRALARALRSAGTVYRDPVELGRR